MLPIPSIRVGDDPIFTVLIMRCPADSWSSDGTVLALAVTGEKLKEAVDRRSAEVQTFVPHVYARI